MEVGQIVTAQRNALPSITKQKHHQQPTRIFTGRNEVVAKVIFLHLSVILFTGGGFCLNACWDTSPPDQADPLEQTPPPGADTPLGADTPPEAYSSIRSTSGWYASYWNAFLSYDRFTVNATALFIKSSLHDSRIT